MASDQTVMALDGLSSGELGELVTSDIKEVFSTMVGMENLLQVPVQADRATRFKNCVTAMVGLAGTYNGVVSLHAPQNLAQAFTSGMLGLETAEPDDVHDALGEIANMIAGSFKHHLSSSGAEIRISIPSVMTGKEYTVSSGRPEETLMLGFSAENECFMVSALLEKV